MYAFHSPEHFPFFAYVYCLTYLSRLLANRNWIYTLVISNNNKIFYRCLADLLITQYCKHIGDLRLLFGTSL